MSATVSLTANQATVLEVLRQAGRPLSAYQILDKTAVKGVRAPPQVYRALDKLIDAGLVHRIASLNAFLFCEHPNHQDDVAFAICDSCGRVTEVSMSEAEPVLAQSAAGEGFKLRAAHAELRGVCGACSK
ncbi:MAG: Fur family transcriptional regulator [Bauldia sp.]